MHLLRTIILIYTVVRQSSLHGRTSKYSTFLGRLSRSVIGYRPGDVIMAASNLVGAVTLGTDDGNKAYSDDLRLRMMGAFLYQEETPP